MLQRSFINKKGQNFIIKEIFVFVIGIVLSITIGAMFSNFIAPEIREFTIDKKMDQFLSHLDFITTRVYLSIVDISDDINVTYRVALPSELSGSKYKVEIINRQICLTIQRTSDSKCWSTSMPANVTFTGDAFSGVNTEIQAYKNDTAVSIKLRNG